MRERSGGDCHTKIMLKKTPLFSKEGQGEILAEDKTKLIREINIVIKSPLTPLF